VARQTKIGIYGRYRPTGPDQGELNKSKAFTEAVAGLGQQATDYLKQKQKDELSSYRATANNDTFLKLDELQRQYKDDPAAFEAAAKSYTDTVIKTAPEPLRRILTGDFDTAITKRIVKTRDAYDLKHQQELLGEWTEGTLGMESEGLNSIRNGADAALEINRYEDHVDSTELLTPEQKAIAKSKYRTRAKAASYMGMFDSIVEKEEDPERQILRAKALRDEIAQADVKELSPEQKDTFLNKMDVRINKLESNLAKDKAELTLDAKRRISDIEIQVATGKITPDNYDEFADEVEGLFISEAITAPKRTQLLANAYNKINNKSKAELDKQKAFQDIEDVLGGVDFEDGVRPVLDKRYVDNHFNEVYWPTIESLPESDRAKVMAAYIEKTRMVPSKVKGLVDQYVTSGDISLISQAQDLVSRVDTLPGMLNKTADKDTKAFIETSIKLSEYMPEEEAIAEAKRRIDPQNANLMEARAKQLKDIEKDDDEFFDDGIKDALEGWTTSDLNPNGFEYADIKNDYKELYTHYFTRTGDKDTANRLATQDLKAYWADSEFGFMRNKPELFYNMSGPEIRDDVYEALRQEVFGEDFSKGSVKLFSDDITEREVSSGRPTYRVMYMRENGDWNFMEDRFYPDEEKARKVRLTRAEREFQIEQENIQREKKAEELSEARSTEKRFGPEY